MNMLTDITEWIVRIPVLLFAITIHEYSHGKAALSLGDPTAQRAGRLTMNPLSHIDPIGAICLFLFNFGWAKPVPVNIRYFKNIRRDTILMALSGPVANLAAAFVTGIFLRFYFIPNEIYLKVLFYLLIMNLGLGLFNLIPIPPLDGSHVLENLLHGETRRKYLSFQRYGPFFLLGIILLENVTHIGIFNFILGVPMTFLARLFGGENVYRLLGMIH
ncbi:MAG: site-2 protease family protein [Deltaproteobacteria bacterium]|nr:site-2 protease family protein [Deltaproteobacteria bacterium]MBW2130466.1 site-2 protease family protein [Deltaproteobacteria bacterium]MBW2305096.1 site-2 protease family protein [Deltaproteobacteria bacterium]